MSVACLQLMRCSIVDAWQTCPARTCTHAVASLALCTRARRGAAVPLRQYLQQKRQYVVLYRAKLERLRHAPSEADLQHLAQVNETMGRVGRWDHCFLCWTAHLKTLHCCAAATANKVFLALCAIVSRAAYCFLPGSGRR